MLVIGNWKTYISSETMAKELAELMISSKKVETIVFPSALHISSVFNILKERDIKLGVQIISDGEKAETGGLTAKQIKDKGVSFVIIGHNERRKRGVTEEAIIQKVCYTLKNNLTPIICISNMEQLDSCLNGMNVDGCIGKLGKCIFAYEPVDYIGATQSMKSDDVKKIILKIRAKLKNFFLGDISLLYGGSVDASNVIELRDVGNVDGFLVGRASTNIGEINLLIKNLSL